MNTVRESIFRYTLAVLSRVSSQQAAKLAITTFTKPIRIPTPKSEFAFSESSTAFRFKNRYQAFRWGEPSDKKILLLHGWNGRGTQMAAFAKPLVERGFCVFAFNAPGHYQSEGHTLDPKLYAEFMLDIDREFGPFKATIAHSFGAGVSVLASKLGLRTEKQVLIASPCAFEKVMRAYSDWILLNEDSRKRFYEMMTKRVGITPEEMNVGILGNQTQVSALIIHDTKDTEVNVSEAHDTHQLWKNSKLHISNGLGHRKILKNPEIVDTVVQFIVG